MMLQCFTFLVFYFQDNPVFEWGGRCACDEVRIGFCIINDVHSLRSVFLNIMKTLKYWTFLLLIILKVFHLFSVRCAWTSELSSLSCLNLWGTKIKLAGISVTKFWTCMMTNMHHRMISMIIFYLHYLTMLEPDWRVNIAYEILFKAETDWAGGPWLLLWKVIIVAIFLNDDNIQFCFWLEVKNNSHSALTKDQISNCLAIF